MDVLSGVRVVDFGRYIAGPFCAALLGDLGADVIRVERVDGGDDRFVNPMAGDGSGAMFLQLGRNKRGLTLNPLKPEGAEVARKLIATADVVIANLPPPTLRSMGLDYETLRSIKPDIILTTVTAFGRGGPWGDKLGFDALAQSASGNLHMSGSAEAPTRSFTPYVDFGTGSLSAFGTLAALRHRDETGEGQIVEGALLRTALTFMGSALLEQDLTAPDRVATLNRGQTSGPSDVVRTQDGWVICSVIGQSQFERWAEMVGATELVADARFKDDEARGLNGEILSARMAEWCETRTNAEVLAEMEKARVPAGPVYSPQEALDEPHIQAINALERVDYPSTEKPPLLARFPLELSGTPGRIKGRAPLLGEHTDEILHELGYDDSAIESLRELSVV